MKKFILYSGLILGILLLLYLGIGFWLRQRTADRVEAKRQAIEDAGDRVYLTEYETEPIPDEENAYHYLMLAQADVDAFATDWERVGESFEYERRLHPEQVDELAAVVDKYPKMFEHLEQAAACEQYRAKIDYSEGIGMLLPHASSFRSAARALAAKALVVAYQGDGDAALKQCEISLRLTRHLRHEPTLISHLVHLVSQRIAVLTANQTLRVAETSREARRQVDDVLAGLDNRQGVVDAMKGERAMGILTFEQLREGKLDPDGLGFGSGSRISVLSTTWLGQAYLNDDEAKYIEILNKQIEAATLPKQRGEKVMEAVFDDLRDSGFRHVLTRLLVPALGSVVTATDRTEAANRCLRVLLAIEEKDDPVLAAIDLLEEARTDPFSDQPLMLRDEEGEPLVYSVGENGVDDGGKIYPPDNEALDIGLGPLLEPEPREPESNDEAPQRD